MRGMHLARRGVGTVFAISLLAAIAAFLLASAGAPAPLFYAVGVAAGALALLRLLAPRIEAAPPWGGRGKFGGVSGPHMAGQEQDEQLKELRRRLSDADLTQQRLELSEAKLAEAQRIARLGSWEWEIAADRVTWSDELYRIYGVTPEVEPGSYGSYLDKVHPDDRARFGRIIETALTERRPWSLDYRIVRPDGDLRMIHARGEIVLDETGRPAVVHGTCQDVTENHRMEDQLRAAEQLFRRAFDDAPIGMALIDLDGRWLRLNRSLCQMLGRSEQQLRTTELNELSHPDDRLLDRPLIKELLAGRRHSFAIEKRYLRADGTMVHALVHVSLMHGDGERPLYFLCELVDVSERRRAEAERRGAQEQLHAIIEHSPALVTVMDLEHRYVLVNRRWEELFGVRAEQAIGRTSEEVLPASRRPDQVEIDERVAQTGQPYEAMMVIPEPDSEDERTFLMLKFALRDVDGTIYAVCTTATDITERRRSAEERAELENRLAEAQKLEAVELAKLEALALSRVAGDLELTSMTTAPGSAAARFQRTDVSVAIARLMDGQPGLEVVESASEVLIEAVPRSGEAGAAGVDTIDIDLVEIAAELPQRDITAEDLDAILLSFQGRKVVLEDRVLFLGPDGESAMAAEAWFIGERRGAIVPSDEVIRRVIEWRRHEAQTAAGEITTRPSTGAPAAGRKHRT